MTVLMSSSDLERSYIGTYLGFKTDDIIDPVYVVGVDGSNLVLTPYKKEKVCIPYTDPCIEYKYPDLGHVLVNNSLLWLERVPDRQWHKGVKAGLVRVINTTSSSRTRTLRDMEPSVTYKALDFIYNNKYTNTVKKYVALWEDFYYYKGAKICNVNEIDSLPEELFFIKDEILESIC